MGLVVQSCHVVLNRPPQSELGPKTAETIHNAAAKRQRHCGWPPERQFARQATSNDASPSVANETGVTGACVIDVLVVTSYRGAIILPGTSNKQPFIYETTSNDWNRHVPTIQTAEQQSTQKRQYNKSLIEKTDITQIHNIQESSAVADIPARCGVM